MPKPFNLAGLLRLRHIQEETAAADLARANTRVRDNANIEKRARRALADYGDQATSTETLRAIAASRQTSAAMLAELHTLRQEADSELLAAQDAYREARMRSVGLEKLEQKHKDETIREDLKAEQNALDEIAQARPRENGDDA